MGAYVPTSAVATSITFDEDLMHVSLADGRVISVPIIWYDRLANATAEQRSRYEISRSGTGIHWPDIDEDLSVAGFMAGVDIAAA
ncbi:MAG: DUF2442 domain-containing protein [Acidobacteria bacterium]|nr:DUF2442 domain-containing protein [Acidobacteriota bacterium]